MNIQNATSVIVKDFQVAKIHTFVAPYNVAANATHVIEGEKELVLVDTQFITPMANAFKGYVEDLGKPVNRIFISHGHPDHYFGLASAFSDVRAYSLEDVNTIIGQSGPQMIKNQKPAFGDLIPDEIVVPKHAMQAGTSETIDGITYEYGRIDNVESEAQLIINLPDLEAAIVQDMIYSDVHLWIGMGFFDNWIEAASKLLTSKANYFLAGHGMPCSKSEVLANIEYLQTAKNLFEEGLTQKEYKSKLLELYPHRDSAMMFDLYLGFLFGQNVGH
jgi:metal-dependent hydrolase (beta-lactamase superfamily II)